MFKTQVEHFDVYCGALALGEILAHFIEDPIHMFSHVSNYTNMVSLQMEHYYEGGIIAFHWYHFDAIYLVLVEMQCT